MLQTFLHALNRDGLLLLGSSEGLGTLHECFSVVDARLKVFRKIRGVSPPSSRPHLYMRKGPYPHLPARRTLVRAEPTEAEGRFLAVYDLIAAQCGVSGLLMDEQGRLLHVFGDAARMLTIRAGRQPDEAISLLPDALQEPARTLLRRALLAKHVCRSEAISVPSLSHPVAWILTATPFMARENGNYVLLSAHQDVESPREAVPTVPLSVDLEECYKARVADLEREVTAVRKNLQTTVDELQTTNEELQSSNEELQSANEELQSANQELQSVNEELHTVNSEYDQKHRLLADLIRDHDNLLHNTEVGIIFVDNECRIRRFNPAATRLFRLIPRDVGRNLADITSDVADISEFQKALARVLAAGIQQEQTVDAPNGSSHLLRLTPYRTEASTVEGVLITATDITKQRQLEEQVRHGQRLEAIGRLAGGIAHDFNNLLCGIQGYAQLLEERTRDEEQLRPLRAIQEAATQAASWTANLLAFGRKAKVESKPLDLHQMVRAALNLAATNLQAGIRLRVGLDAPRSVVVGDGAQLQAMVLNLHINAKDSMPRGGAITITTRLAALDLEKAAALRPAVPAGPYLLLGIADEGEGIASEYLDHLFEPFYATKGAGGNGLGLAAVYGTVSEHGGGIQLETSEQGTRFIVHLPLAGEDVVLAPRGGMRGPLQRGVGSVLVVDDQVSIREMVSDFLGGLGYTVTLADSGHRAIATYQQHGPFDLVLLDVTMPGMNGVEVFRVLRDMDPAARILLTAGQTFGQVDDELFHQGALRVRQETVRPRRCVRPGGQTYPTLGSGPGFDVRALSGGEYGVMP